MKTLIATLLLSIGAAFAQSTLSLTGPATAKPGATIPIALTLTNTASSQIAALQWSILYPAGGFSATVTPGAVVVGANKPVQCTGDNSFCLMLGSNFTAIANGTVANYLLKVPATAVLGTTVTVTASGFVAISPTGAVTTTNSLASYSFKIAAPPEDINGDGKIDSADLQAIVSQVLASQSDPTACVSDLNGDGKCDIRDAFTVLQRVLGQ